MPQLPRAVSTALRWFGGTAGLAVLLVVVGFLSESARFGFAGLPLMELREVALLEAGASTLIDAAAAVVESPLRLALLVGLFTVMLLVVVQREADWVARILASSKACLSAGMLLVGILSMFTLGMLPIARLGIPDQLEIMRTSLAEELADGVRQEHWTVSREHRRLRRASTPMHGIFTVNALFTSNGDPAADELSKADRLVTSRTQATHMLREPESAEIARTLFGWSVWYAVVLLSGMVALRLWMRHLTRLAASEAPGGSDRGALMPAMTYIVEPLGWVFALTGCLLLPMGHGVLADSSIGKERVMVFVDQAAEDCGGAAEAASVGEACSPGTLATLAQLREDQLDAEETILRDGGELSILPLLEDAYIRASNDYFDLLERELSCAHDLVRYYDVLPSEGLWTIAPRAAAATNSRVALFEREHRVVLVGHMLSYPRAGGVLTLVNAERPGNMARPWMWRIEQVPARCIEQVTVVGGVLPDPMSHTHDDGTVHADADTSRPDRDLPTQRNLSFVLRQLRDPFALSVPERGSMLTEVGALGRMHRDTNPLLASATCQTLIRVMTEEETPQAHKGAAATSLHRVGGRACGEQLAHFVESRGSEVLRSVPEAITAAGYLARDLASVCQERRAEVLVRALGDIARDGSWDYRSVACASLARSQSQLGRRIALDVVDSVHEGAADGGYGQTTTMEQCLAAASSTLRFGCPGERPSAGDAIVECREYDARLRAVARSIVADEALADSTRTRALIALRERGLHGDAELIVGRFLDEPTGSELGAMAALVLDEPAGSETLALFADAVSKIAEGQTRELSVRAVYGLALTDNDDDGDAILLEDEGAEVSGSALASALVEAAGRDASARPHHYALTELYEHPAPPGTADPLAVAACTAVFEFALRGGVWAQKQTESGLCGLDAEFHSRAASINATQGHLRRMALARNLPWNPSTPAEVAMAEAGDPREVMRRARRNGTLADVTDLVVRTYLTGEPDDEAALMARLILDELPAGDAAAALVHAPAERGVETRTAVRALYGLALLAEDWTGDDLDAVQRQALVEIAGSDAALPWHMAFQSLYPDLPYETSGSITSLAACTALFEWTLRGGVWAREALTGGTCGYSDDVVEALEAEIAVDAAGARWRALQSAPLTAELHRQHGGGVEAGAPEPFRLPQLDGGVQAFALPPERDTLVNFWATSCGWCRAEMPVLQEWAASNPDVVFVGVNEDAGVAEARVRRMADTFPEGTTHFLDPEGGVRRAWGGVGLPMTVFLGQDGTVRYHHRAFASVAEVEELVDPRL